MIQLDIKNVTQNFNLGPQQKRTDFTINQFLLHFTTYTTVAVHWKSNSYRDKGGSWRVLILYQQGFYG